VETAGDHEVQDQPVAVVEFDGDAFADAAQGTYGVAFELFERRLTVRRRKGLAMRMWVNGWPTMRGSSAER
jgi:hypothetical protein